MNFFFVALGGAAGACGRYAISLIPVKTQFPVLTLVTNFLGAVLIGFVVGIAENKNVSKNAILFLKTGVCGGFTTFSTFSLQIFELYQKGECTLCIIYLFLSVILSILSLIFGVHLGKII